jgi:predicted aldo/keto reductase-like oxidoreductase
MKSLSGGLIQDIFAARAWLAQFINVVPIYGIQREKELDELFEAMDQPTTLTAEQQQRIAKDQKELTGNFCRGCGYCMPCPEGIQINMCARMPLMLRRAPVATYTNDYWRKEMAKIPNCRHCGLCTSHCPYSLDSPSMLEKSYQDYQSFIA